MTRPYNLVQAFRAAVEHGPEAAALKLPGETVSFAALDEQSSRFAGYLRAKGLRRGDVLALELPKRLETYALMLAALKCGVIYLCMDPKSPVERTKRIVERVRPALVIAEKEREAGLAAVLADAPEPGSLLREVQDRPAVDVEADATTGADPAYLMFTSGSTGEPKGAVIPHMGVLTLISWAREWIGVNGEDTLTAVNPLHFDNSVFDFYCGLFNGAALAPVETGAVIDPRRWVRRITEAGSTMFFAVPTMFMMLETLNLLSPKHLPTVKRFMFGGEGYPLPRLREFYSRFKDQARLINVYGPTETSCICSSRDIDEGVVESESGFASLGRIHKNFSYRIMNAEGNEAEPGESGELWLGGPCVALGYYNDGEETSRRFVQDPMQSEYRSVFYRTGDLVAEDPRTGELWFRGRSDNQVKVRGHRIELEEIEHALETHSAINRSVVLVRRIDEWDELHAVCATQDSLDEECVLDHVRGLLPSYMVPDRIAFVDDLPTNANGKVDRKTTRKLLFGDA